MFKKIDSEEKQVVRTSTSYHLDLGNYDVTFYPDRGMLTINPTFQGHQNNKSVHVSIDLPSATDLAAFAEEVGPLLSLIASELKAAGLENTRACGQWSHR